MKKLIIYAVIFVLLFGSAIGIAYSLVNWDGLRASVEAKAMQHTGHELKINDGVQISFFPRLTITASGISLENVRDDIAANIISISRLMLHYSYFDLLRGKNIIDEAVLIEPQINMEKYLGEDANWASGQQTHVDVSDNIEYQGVFRSVSIQRGSISIITGKREEPLRYDIILDEGVLRAETINGPYLLEGVSYGDIGQPPIEYTINVGDLSNDRQSPLTAFITIGKDRLEIDGKISNWSSNPRVNAKINLRKYLEGFVGDVSAGEQVIRLNSNLNYQDRKLTLQDAEFTAPGVEANGTVALDIIADDDGITTGEIHIESNNANFDSLFKDEQQGLVQEKRLTPYSIFRTVYPFVDNVKFSYDVALNNFQYNNQRISSLRVNTENGESVRRHKVSMDGLPGGSKLSLNARIDESQNTTNGNLQFSGENAWQLMEWLGWTSDAIQPAKFTKYAFKSNFVQGSNQLYFRRVDMEMADMKAIGQFTYNQYEDGRKIVKSALRIPELNLNQIMNTKADDNGEDRSLDTIIFDGIRNIDAVLSQFIFSLHVDRVTIDQKTHKDASVTFDVTPGIMDIRDISMKSNREGVIRGNIRLNTQNLDPIIDVSLALQKLHHEDFLDMLPITTPEDPKEPMNENVSDRWSYNEIYLDYLGIYNGSINVRVDEYFYKNVVAQNVVIRTKLGLSQIEITEAKGTLFGSTFEMNGNITTRPMYLNLFFSTPNMNIRPLLETFFGYTNFDGYSGFSMSVSMSGNSQREWVESMSGSINILARNLTIRGYDLALLTRKIPTLDDVRAVRYWGHKALHSGLTQYKFFTGVFTIQQGIMTLENVKLPHELTNSISVDLQINLPLWTMKLNSPMRVSVGRYQSIPIVLDVEGDINQPQLFWDRKGIERYWAQRFYR